MKPSDLRRLQRLATKIEKDDEWFQSNYGDPVPGSVRLAHRLDAEAIRRVLGWVAERRT